MSKYYRSRRTGFLGRLGRILAWRVTWWLILFAIGSVARYFQLRSLPSGSTGPTSPAQPVPTFTLDPSLLWFIAETIFWGGAAALLAYGIYRFASQQWRDRTQAAQQEHLDPVAEQRVRELAQTHHIPLMPPRLTKPIVYDAKKLAAIDEELAYLKQLPWGRVEPLIAVEEAPERSQQAQAAIRDVNGDWRKLAEPVEIYTRMPAPWCWIGAAQIIATRAFLGANAYSPTGVRLALYCLSEALAVEPNNVDALLLRATLLQANGDSSWLRLRQAEGVLQRVQQLAPEAPELAMTEAQVYSALGRFKLAEAAAREAVRRASVQQDWVRGLDTLGSILDRAKRSEEAVTVYQQIIAVDQENPWVWHNFSLALGHIQQYEAALETSERALALTEFDAARNLNTNLRMLLGRAVWA